MDNNISEVLPAALELLFPGISLFTPFLSYLHADVSSFSIYLTLFVVLCPLFAFILPRFLETVQNVLLYITASTAIPYHDKIHSQFVQWMARNGPLSSSWRSIVRVKTAISLPWQNDDDDDTEEDHLVEQKRFEESREAFWLSLKKQESIKPIRFTPSQKRLHFFLYRGSILALYRDPYQTQNSWLSDTETFTIYTFFWNKNVLSTLLEEVQQASIERRKQKVAICRGFIDRNTTSWVQIMLKPPRPLSTLALPTEIKDDMIEDIEEFLSPRSRAWYESCGIPYRRGYLLYGPPGTGKSSMCFAIAGRLWLDIYMISLNSRKLDEDTLAKLFQSLPKRCIVLLEDVDNAGISQEGSRMSDKGRVGNLPQENEIYGAGISLSALLNCLDGVGAQEGRILMMTTNHRERIDPALIRPGRVDKQYQFGFVDTESVKQLFHLFFNEGLSFVSPISGERELNDPSTLDSISALSDEFAGIISSSQLTGAEVNNYLMGFRGKPKEAVLNALTWVSGRSEVATRDTAYPVSIERNGLPGYYNLS